MRVCSTSLALALLAFHAAEAVVLQPRVRAPLFPSPHALRCLSSSVRLAAEPSETEAAAGDGAVPDGEGMSDAKAEKAAKKAEKDALRAQIDELEKKLTSARGDFVAITEGLEAGEEVITTGQLKVRNGSALVIDNDNAPTPEQNPTPANS